MDHSDAELVERTRRGDLEAFGLLYDRHARLVRAVCADATRDLTTAQDLAQDVFLRAFAGLPRLREPDRFAGWLVGIARVTAKEWLRRRARERPHFGDEAIEPAAPESHGHDERLATLLDLLAELPEMERLAIHAFYLSGQSADQGADALGISRSGFYKLLAAARSRLTIRFQQSEEEVR